MRLVVFFDLPVDTAMQRKEYRLFRKFLIKDGYLMLQESVYAKLVLNEHNAEAALLRMKSNRLPQGLVQVLKVTEKQFASMVFITGEAKESDVLTSKDGLVVI